MRRMAPLRCALAAALVLAAPGTLWARKAPAPPPTAGAVTAVVACRQIADSTQRLACYDEAVAAMQKAEQTGDLVAIDREQRRAARRQAFGLPLPSLSFLDRGEKEADTLTAPISSWAMNGEGKWVITLDGGATWRQIDDNQLEAPHPGSMAKISKGLLGSFFMKVDRQQAIRVHRVS